MEAVCSGREWRVALCHNHEQVLVLSGKVERSGSATAGQRRMNKPETQSGGSLEPVGSARPERQGKRRNILRWRESRLRRLDCIKSMTPRQAERASRLANQIQIAWAQNKVSDERHNNAPYCN
jgi:hypothetical protein